MMKFVSLLAIAAIGMLIWALQPAPVKEVKKPKAAPTVYETRTGSTTKSVSAQSPVNNPRVDGTNQQIKPSWSPKLPAPNVNNSIRQVTGFTQTKTTNGKDPVATLPGLSKRESKDRPDILPHPVATEGEFAVKGYKQPGDEMDPPKEPIQENESFPRVAAKSFKKAVRSFYENLPKSGVIPSRIMVDEVLPQALVAGIGIPPETELKMLGPHYVNDIKSFKYALGSPQDIIGVSYTTPDGKYHRKYIRLEGDKTE